MSSKVGGIARAPVWGANLSYKSSPKSQPLLNNNNNNNSKQHGLPSSKQLVQVRSSASCKLMWEISIPTDRVIKANRPDLVLVLDDRALLLDVSVPLDHRVDEKVQENISKYLPLAAELRRIWNKR